MLPYIAYMDPMGTEILDWMIFAKIVILKGRMDNPMPGYKRPARGLYEPSPLVYWPFTNFQGPPGERFCPAFKPWD